MQNTDMTIDQRIKKEKARLSKFYKDMAPEKKGIAVGLIERAAFMRVQCEDLEIDLNENGWTEMFQQSDKVDPYTRARPEGQTYNTLNANYQKIIKQLDGMLPKTEPKPADDGMDDFIDGREDE